MKNTFKYFLVMFMLILSTHITAQLNEWTWMHGDNIANSVGSFGVQGVPSPTNEPPSVYEACEWTDRNGNFWLYGGQHAGRYADLWKYDPVTNEWVWVKGPGVTGAAAVYGTQGVPSSANTPGGKGWGPSTWTDINNNLWMFGGTNQNNNDMNVLWMYSISTNEWTWMKGANVPNSLGNPGTMGIPNLTNEPPARHESTCSWIDGNGDLWMFGGFCQLGYTDDLWHYSISTNMWTWMKGDPFSSVATVYGTRGVSDPMNTPGGRCAYTRWADGLGNFWLFGGLKNGSIGYGNDLWRYTLATNEWTWMKGSNTDNNPGFYGSLCVEDSLNNPPARYENRSCWTDSCGNFWMFGGKMTGDKNDLWKYNPVTNNWTWVSGSNGLNDLGNYGTIGVSSSANVPRARDGSLSWQDKDGNLWLGFGWINSLLLNDLWRYIPDPACAGCSQIPVALFSAPNHICPGTCTDFVNLSQSATSFIWTFNGGSPNFSTDVNPTNICYYTPGTFSVSLIATNSVTSDTITLNNYITVYPYPPPQGIMQSGDTLFANAGGVSYQWFENGVIIPGATNSYYVALESGNYNVVVTDENDCEVEAVIFDVIASIQSVVGNSQFEIFPNPALNTLEIKNPLKNSECTFKIFNMIGEDVDLPIANCKLPTCSIDVSSLPSGIYWLNIIEAESVTRIPFTKQ